ncbi:hypothetical protein [Bacillus massilioanorexius]|uniref:hypothetical protein n=1 Tax=Bacillus TaxID=1386 RepID=UPI000360E9C9
MKKIFSIMITTLLMLSFLSVPNQVLGAPNSIPCNPKTTKLKLEQRKLWVLQRLLQNQTDIGNSIKPFYGEKAGNQLTKLLKEHIVLAGQVVDAAKSGNQQALNKYNKLWYKNADDIAAFLSKANPNWSYEQLKDMLHKHLGFVTEEAVARLKKDWKANIAAFDKGENHMLMLADLLANGIIKQFPQKFK